MVVVDLPKWQESAAASAVVGTRGELWQVVEEEHELHDWLEVGFLLVHLFACCLLPANKRVEGPCVNPGRAVALRQGHEARPHGIGKRVVVCPPRLAQALNGHRTAQPPPHVSKHLHPQALGVGSPAVDKNTVLKVGFEGQAVTTILLHEADQLCRVGVRLHREGLSEKVNCRLHVGLRIELRRAKMREVLVGSGRAEELARAQVHDTVRTAQEVLWLLLGKVENQMVLEHLQDFSLILQRLAKTVLGSRDPGAHCLAGASTYFL
mmetsp:Transcript_21813/g.50625  ORF Transcript_21813/g.50625 Transcript_21813/m.50625 type:complete len:265 (-) Transcript_21813:184-978(-)